MSDFINEFMKQFGPQVASGLSKNLGIGKSTAKQIIPEIVPLILSGLRKQKDEQGGEARIDHILNKYGSPDVLNNIKQELASRSQDDKPDPGLGGLLGKSGLQATGFLQKQFGLDNLTAGKLIPMVTPFILGALTRKRDQGGTGSTGIAALQDQDGDGSILDDVSGFLTGIVGGGKQRGGNPLGQLLGGLLSRRR